MAEMGGTMGQITKLELVQVEVAQALERIIIGALEVMPRKRRDLYQPRLLDASTYDELDKLRPAIVRVINVMGDAIYEASSEITDLTVLRKRALELISILRIAQTFPDSALTRAKRINGKLSVAA